MKITVIPTPVNMKENAKMSGMESSGLVLIVTVNRDTMELCVKVRQN